MNAALAPLLFWHTLVVTYAGLLAIEAPALLFIALYKTRPWRELLVVGVPAAAFVWALWTARTLQATYDYWKAYWQFEFASNPVNYPQQYLFDGIRGAVAAATSMGWTVGIVTTALLILGWGVAVHWLTDTGEKRTPALQSAATADVESGELEITVEAIQPAARTTTQPRQTP
jgi:hypothetical protein